MSELLDIIRERRSVRTFDGRKMSAEDRKKILRYVEEISNPFDVPVRFVFLNAIKHGLSSPVITGEIFYVAGIVEKGPYAEIAFGYSFEKLVLYAWSLGVGTTWIAGTMNREAFEAAVGLGEKEMMPCVSPLGYPAERQSIRETLMRKGVGADRRRPAEELFFDGTPDKPMDEEQRAGLGNLVEMVRWAPSAVNKQPWRIIKSGEMFHLYKKKDKGYVSEETGDLQKIDIGIALCHLVSGLEEMGKQPKILVQDPGIPVPAETEYVVSVICGEEAEKAEEEQEKQGIRRRPRRRQEQQRQWRQKRQPR